MALPTNRASRDPISSADINAIAAAANLQTAHNVVYAVDTLTAAEQLDVSSYTGAIDVTAKIQAVIEAWAALGQAVTILFSRGKYKINNLMLRDNVSLVAEGYVPGMTTGAWTATKKPVQFVGSSPGWTIDSPGTYIYGSAIAGIHFEGPDVGVSRGAIHHQFTRYCAVTACSGMYFTEWGILQEFGWGNAYLDNMFIHVLLDRSRSIDLTTLPHGAIELRGFNNTVRGGEYGATVGTPGDEQAQVFGAAVVTGTFGAGGSGGVADLGAGASAVDDAYNGYFLEITSGAQATAVAYISDYVGSTKLATLNGNVPFSGFVLSGESYRLSPMRCVGGAFKGGDTDVVGGVYEISEAGIWVSTSGDAHKFTNVTSDLNAGPGWLLAGEALITGSKAHRASKAGHGLYDGYVAIWEKAGVISGSSSGGNTGDVVYERNGFFSGYFSTNPANQWKVSAFAHRGLRTGQRIKRLAGAGQDADGIFAAPAATSPAISVWQEGVATAAWQIRPDTGLRNGAGDIALFRLASGLWGMTGGLAAAYLATTVVAQTLAANGPVAITAASGGVNRITLNANATALTITNGSVNGQELEVHFIQDATGSRTLTAAPTNVRWQGAAPPVLTTTINRRDILRFRWNNNDTKWDELARSMNVG